MFAVFEARIVNTLMQYIFTTQPQRKVQLDGTYRLLVSVRLRAVYRDHSGVYIVT